MENLALPSTLWKNRNFLFLGILPKPDRRKYRELLKILDLGAKIDLPGVGLLGGQRLGALAASRS